MSTLPPTARRTVRKASREAIEESLSITKGNFKQDRWLGKRNRYRDNTIDRIYKDTRPGNNPRHLQLSQYIAASAPLHCVDGWALLGRAIDCHARRDHDSARHFAYYAELRAAVSLLASEGIAIFNTNHFAVQDPRQCLRFGGRTHEVTWQALEYWADLKRASDLLSSSILANGIALEDWLEHFPPHGSLRAIGAKWLKTWGLDLRLFSGDQTIRNEASYRPTKLTKRPSLDVDDSADFICEFWSLCEPAVHAPFNILDRHLLRLALEETFWGTRGTSAAADALQFRTDVEAMLSHVMPGSTAQHGWLDFLTRVVESDDPLIVLEARRNDEIDTPRQHLQMISRAALLLRVATAASSQLLQETDVSSADVQFWWSTLGEERGLWLKGKWPADFTDLWADAESAVKNIVDWKAKTAEPDRSLVHWRQSCAHDISVLGGCERIALWGLEL